MEEGRDSFTEVEINTENNVPNIVQVDGDEEDLRKDVNSGLNNRRMPRMPDGYVHHKGKIKIEYVQDKYRRMKTFYKRFNTLKVKAGELGILTGSEIQLKILNKDNKKTYTYYTTPKVLRTVQLQKGGSFVQQQKSNQPDPMQNKTQQKNAFQQTEPAKSPPKFPSPYFKDFLELPPVGSSHIASLEELAEDSLLLEFCPGKMSTPVKQVTRSLVNNCRQCGVVFESKHDRSLFEIYGKRNEWIGCDKRGCTYWGHARCLLDLSNIDLESVDSFSVFPFLCTEHANLEI